MRHAAGYFAPWLETADRYAHDVCDILAVKVLRVAEAAHRLHSTGHHGCFSCVCGRMISTRVHANRN
jgi:hypothetical protein